MKKFIFFLTAICLSGLSSCTKEKTDYEAEIDTVVPEYHEFKEVVAIHSGAYHISLEALNGTFYKGYNEIRLKITDVQTKENVHASTVSVLPIRTSRDGSTASCPHQHDMLYRQDGSYFSGYSVFTDESNSSGTWEFYVNFTVEGKSYSLKQAIAVQTQPNKNLNMTAFTGEDGRQYIIALISPQRPSVGEHELVAGIYIFNEPTNPPSGTFPDATQFSYSEVDGYTLLLDPRMPEPSMGNHSSPNNKDLTQQDDGLYYGVVNYTMTGSWTLNFILLDENNQVLKGTEVPPHHTPMEEGAKSELYIDIQF